jgi:hypothetical protein
MINSNQRILRKLESENNVNIKKTSDSNKQKKQTRSVRLKFWESDKSLFLGLNQGCIETISKSEDVPHLTRNHFLNIKDVICSIKYLPFCFDNKDTSSRNIMTVQCPTSIWMVDIQQRQIIGGGKLDKRLAKNEKISSMFSVHEGRVMCVFTDQSNVLLLLIRQSELKVDLIFLEKSKLEINNISGQSQFGK